MAVTNPRSPPLPSYSGNMRRRKATATTIAGQPPPGMKQINAGPLLETAKPGIDPDAPFTVSRAIGVAGVMAHAAFPAIVSWGVTMGLIFGGCCSNVGPTGTVRVGDLQGFISHRSLLLRH